MNKRKTNIKNWLKTLTLGLISGLSCFCFCGGCNGRITAPFKNQVYPGDTCENIEQWTDHGCVALKCVPFCGICCGLCGEFGPEDVK